MKTLPNKFYIAHGLYSRKKVHKIQTMLEKRYTLELINPFYQAYRDEIVKLDSFGGKNERKYYGKMQSRFTMKTCCKIVEQDLEMLDKCDGVLAIIDGHIVGTAMEIQYAKLMGKHVWIVAYKYHNHPWIRAYADRLFPNIRTFEQFLKRMGYSRQKVK